LLLICKPIKYFIMKKIKFLGLLVLLLMILPAPKSYAQVEKQEKLDFEMSITGPSADGGKTTYTFTGGLEQIRINPSGKIKRTITFQLPAQHPFLYFAYATVSVDLDMDIDGDEVDDISVKDKRAVLTPSGLLKFKVKYNPKKTPLID